MADRVPSPMTLLRRSRSQSGIQVHAVCLLRVRVVTCAVPTVRILTFHKSLHRMCRRTTVHLEIVGLALNHHLPTIAYTYTEPLTWYEYVYDTASLAQEKGLYNVLVSAGYIQEAPLRALAPLLDAANIDLKSFSDETYRKFNKASLEPVLRTLLILHEMNVHLEITLLLIPGVNTDEAMLHKMFAWITAHGLNHCAFHISRFFPMYQMEAATPTPIADLRKAKQIAREEGVAHVYLGNI